MSDRAINSKSFLREDKFAFEADQEGEIQEYLKRDRDGELVLSKKTIAELVYQNGFTKQVILNALYLQNYKADEIKQKMRELAKYLEQEHNLRGIVEFHANDSTQQSFHIHFNTNDDSSYVYHVIRDYIIEHKWASALNVDIQDQYVSIYEMDLEERGEEFEALREVRPAIDYLEEKPVEQKDEIESKRLSIRELLRKTTEELLTGTGVDQKDAEGTEQKTSAKQVLADIDGLSNEKRIEKLEDTLKSIRKSRRNR